ncbi:MAG: B12-binding domain-containing radical SAM protein [Desulfobacterales bacterium]|nr:B12-binding domain-containing radical SAM protein [Desulfobacterales bacterium]
MIHPAGSNWISGKKDITATTNRMAPIGILSIAAFLEKDNHEVYVYDCYGPKASLHKESNVKQIMKYRPDIVGFSTTTSSFLDAYDLATSLKQTYPEIKTIFGGAHISAMGEMILETYQNIDMLCIGEGEMTFSELAKGKSTSLINGLVFKENGKIVSNHARSYIKNLDELPFPSYEKLNGFPEKYHLPLFSYIHKPGATMITSRGCPYQCSFCDRSVFKNRFRYNSAEYIYEHMYYLEKRFKVKHINIYDDLFTTKRERISELCELLINKPLKMNFNCIVRVGHIDDELLLLLKKAGFLQLSIGIESGDPEILQSIKQGMSLEAVKKDVEKIKAHGLRAKGLFIMGLPGETEASIMKTSDFVMSLDLDDMNMSKFTPFFGTPIWDSISKIGTLDNDWKKMNCLNFVFVPNGIESKQRLDQLYNEHIKRFYSDKKWQKKFKQRIWEHRNSLLYMLAHFPSFLSAKRTFEPE